MVGVLVIVVMIAAAVTALHDLLSQSARSKREAAEYRALLQSRLDNDRRLIALGTGSDEYRRFLMQRYSIARDQVLGKFVCAAPPAAFPEIGRTSNIFDTLDAAIVFADAKFQAAVESLETYKAWSLARAA